MGSISYFIRRRIFEIGRNQNNRLILEFEAYISFDFDGEYEFLSMKIS